MLSLRGRGGVGQLCPSPALTFQTSRRLCFNFCVHHPVAWTDRQSPSKELEGGYDDTIVGMAMAI